MAAVRNKKDNQALAGALALARQITRFPVGRMWLDYDAQADVLYISFKRPQKATDTGELNDGGILMRYRGKELVGITVLFASER